VRKSCISLSTEFSESASSASTLISSTPPYYIPYYNLFDMLGRPKRSKAGANMPASAKRPPKSASQPVPGSKPCGRAKKASTPGNHSRLPTLIEIGDVASSKSGSTVPEAPPSIPESIVPTFASQIPEDLEDDIPFIQANSVCEHSPSSFSRERQL